MSELRPETRSMLRAGRALHDPATGAKDRVRRSIHATLGVGAAAGTSSVSGAATAGGAAGVGAQAGAAALSAGVGAGTKALIALAFVAAGGVWTTQYLQVAHEAPPAALPATSAPSTAPSFAAVATPTSPRTTQPTALPVATSASVPATLGTSPTPSASVAKPATDRVRASPVVPSIGAEVALLAGARAALAGSHADRALAILDEHARRFPDGALREEREMERIDALCALGRRDDAARVARSFARAYPGSPLLSRVGASCASFE